MRMTCSGLMCVPFHNQEVLQAYQRCAANQTAMSKRAFDDWHDWQQACGVTHTQPAFAFFVQTAFGPEHLAANQPVVPRLDARNGFTGGYASNGMPAVCNTGLGKCGDSVETYLKLWTLPATWQKAGSLPELFSSKKVKSYKEAKKFKCSASEH